jgi:radical SAM superfamily enzyme YgiQ (UPF0313 family)
MSFGNTIEPSREELINRGFAPKNGSIDIMFLFPPTSAMNDYAHRYGKKDLGNLKGDLIPLGIATLAAYLRENNFGVGVLDCIALGMTHDDIVEIIKEREPQSIGISATTYALPASVILSERLRQEFPDLLIILGGAHANVAGVDAAEKFPSFDIVSYSPEGEPILLDILQKYSMLGFNRETLLNDIEIMKSIKGIIFKYDNEIIQNMPGEIVKDLDFLPEPARDLFPLERYAPLPNQYKKLPLTNMVVIRGCPYVCTFCDQAATTARQRSPQKVIGEIKNVVEQYGVKEISFWDDTMSYNKKWMQEFCELLIDAKLDVIWSCYAAINTVNQEILNLMKKAGCWNIFYGYETGVPQLAKNIKTDRKNKSMEKMLEVTKWTKNAGIEIRGAFMLALPGENPELAEQTIQNAIKLDPEYAQFSICTPYPGTALYNEIKSGKWGKLTTEDFSEFQCWNVVFLPDGYDSIEQVNEMSKKAFRKFYFRPKYVLKAMLNIRSLEDIKRYYTGFIALIKGFAFGPMPSDIRTETGRVP